MFNSDYIIRGEYGEHGKFLCKEEGVNIFRRNLDLLMVAPLVGVCTGRFVKQTDISPESKEKTFQVLLGQIDNERRNLVIIYRLVMLANPYSSASNEDKVDQALRFDSVPDSRNPNMEIFDGYVKGGIEYLYECFKNAPLNSENKKEWIIDELMDFVNELRDPETADDIDASDFGVEKY